MYSSVNTGIFQYNICIDSGRSGDQKRTNKATENTRHSQTTFKKMLSPRNLLISKQHSFQTVIQSRIKYYMEEIIT